MNTAADQVQHAVFGAVEQIGFVVPDMDEALARYQPIFGPFNLADYDIGSAIYQGEEQACEFKFAFAMTGDLEIELIQPVSGKSPHSDFIKNGGNGMHHLRYRSDNIERDIESAASLGYSPLWYKRVDENIAFVYLQRENDPLIVELLEMPR